MKRVTLSAFLFILGAVGCSQAAVRIGFLGGYALATENNYGQAFAYGASLTFDLHKNFAIELRGVRFQYSVAGSVDGLSTGTLAVLPLEIGLKGQFPLAGGRFTPFVGLGAGYSIHQFTLDSQVAGNWESIGFRITEKLNNAVVYHIGAGLEIALNRSVALVLEARFRIIQSDGSWTIADLVGNEETSGDLSKLNQNSIVFGLGLQFSLR